MARKKHIAPYLILWRVNPKCNPVENDWLIFESYQSLAMRNLVFDKINATSHQIIEYKRETNHNSPFINPNKKYEQINPSNRP